MGCGSSKSERSFKINQHPHKLQKNYQNCANNDVCFYYLKIKCCQEICKIQYFCEECNFEICQNCFNYCQKNPDFVYKHPHSFKDKFKNVVQQRNQNQQDSSFTSSKAGYSNQQQNNIKVIQKQQKNQNINRNIINCDKYASESDQEIDQNKNQKMMASQSKIKQKSQLGIQIHQKKLSNRAQKKRKNTISYTNKSRSYDDDDDSEEEKTEEEQVDSEEDEQVDSEKDQEKDASECSSSKNSNSNESEDDSYQSCVSNQNNRKKQYTSEHQSSNSSSDVSDTESQESSSVSMETFNKRNSIEEYKQEVDIRQFQNNRQQTDVFFYDSYRSEVQYQGQQQQQPQNIYDDYLKLNQFYLSKQCVQAALKIQRQFRKKQRNENNNYNQKVQQQQKIQQKQLQLLQMLSQKLKQLSLKNKVKDTNSERYQDKNCVQAAATIQKYFRKKYTKRVVKKQNIQEKQQQQNQLNLCLICMEQDKNAVFQDCGHLSCCYECAELMVGKACPICRKDVKKIMKVYIT